MLLISGATAADLPCLLHMIALHRPAGFRETGVLREVGRKFGHWLDLLFMQKRLSGPEDPDA